MQAADGFLDKSRNVVMLVLAVGQNLVPLCDILGISKLSVSMRSFRIRGRVLIKNVIPLAALYAH